MAAKRSANSDLNHENWDDEVEAEEAGSFVPANAEVLKDRVIKKARRRGVGPDGGGTTTSVFAGFGGFKTAAPTGIAPAATSVLASATGAFDFLAGENKNGASSGLVAAAKSSFAFTSPDKAVTDGSSKSVAPVFAFGTGSAPRDPAFGSVGSKPAATGFSFGAKPAGPATTEPAKTGFSFGDKPAAKPSESGLSGFAFGKASTINEPAKPSFLFGEKSSNETAAKPTGFSFGEKAEPAKPSFAFGSAASTKVADSSAKTTFGSFGEKSAAQPEEKKEEKAQPSLMDLFKPKAGTWICLVCDVNNDADKAECVACCTPKPGGAPAPAAKKWECPSCMVYNEADKNSCVCCETPKPGSSVTTKPASGFGGAGLFGSGAAAPSGGSGFKFGVAPSTTPSTASTESVGSGFKFGDSSKSGSGFQFGSSSNESGFKLGAEKKVESEKSESEDSNKEYPKEFLTQLKALNTDVMEWVNTHVDRNPYIYLSPVFKDYEKHLADLKLKFKIQNNNGAIASTGFAAASDTTKPVSKPAETGFKFGNGSASSAASASVVPTAPSFSFGSETSKKNDFSFGSGKSSGSEPAKAGFVFGSSGSTFGSGPSPFGSFAGSGSMSAVGKAAETKEEDEEDSDEPPKVEVAPIVEEDSIHSVRCKIFYKKGKEFADKGLGMLHLKPVEGTKKTQILVRAETSLGNILLNVMLNSQMSLVKRNNNVQFVCIPNPPIAGLADGPVTMLIKVKNGDMADELEAKMKERMEQEKE